MHSKTWMILVVAMLLHHFYVVHARSVFNQLMPQSWDVQQGWEPVVDHEPPGIGTEHTVIFLLSSIVPIEEAILPEQSKKQPGVTHCTVNLCTNHSVTSTDLSGQKGCTN